MGIDFRWLWAAVLVVAAGCGGDDEEAGPPTWDSCEQRAGECTCEMREGGSSLDYPPADDCSGYDCCLLSRSESGTSGSCRCFDTADSCEDIAEASPSSMVVSQCPPLGELLSPRAMCIPEGGRCPNRSLGPDSEIVSGCCEGLLCLSNGKNDGAEDVCQPVANRDPDWAELCERATLIGHEELAIVSATLVTELGEVRFDTVQSTVAGVGPGCLKNLNMAFTAAGTARADGGVGTCELVLDAVLFQGEWVVRRALGSFGGCENEDYQDIAFDVREAAEIPFAFTHTTEECGARDKQGPHCMVGVFDWALTGELVGLDFEGAHLIAEGVVCSQEADDSCDEPN